MSRQSVAPVLPHSVRFLHYRAYDENLKSQTNPLGVDSRTGATVAYTDPDSGTVKGKGFITSDKRPIAYAVAYCHPRDNYNKHLGRTKAMGRLKSTDYVEVTDLTDKREFLSLIDSEMEGYGYTRKYSTGSPPYGEALTVKTEAKVAVQIEAGGEAPPVVVLEPAVRSDV